MNSDPPKITAANKTKINEAVEKALAFSGLFAPILFPTKVIDAYRIPEGMLNKNVFKFKSTTFAASWSVPSVPAKKAIISLFHQTIAKSIMDGTAYLK